MGETLFGEAIKKSPTASIIASVVLSGGLSGLGVAEWIDTQSGREATALREQVDQCQTNAEARVASAEKSQELVLGQLCEYKRAKGDLLPDARCWGRER